MAYIADFLLFLLSEITQVIQVDLDLKYQTNIRDLFDEFDNFPEGAVIGIAREMQPVYRYSALPMGSSGRAVSSIQIDLWKKICGEAVSLLKSLQGDLI